MLGIGIVGCGAISTTHIKAIMNSPHGHLVAVCDIDAERVNAVAEKYDVLAYTAYEEMLANSAIDVIHICTPHFLHETMIEAGVEAGKHILCEKPVVMNMSQGSHLRAQVFDKKVAVCFQNRFNPTSIMMKHYIDEEILGKLEGIKGFVTWHRNEEYYTSSPWRGDFSTEGGGVLINQAIHTLDLMQWLGGDVQWISGSFSTRKLNDVIEVEDTADATIVYTNGATGLFYATNCNVKDSSIDMELMFEKGSLRLLNNSLYELVDGKGLTEVASEISGTVGKSYWGVGHNRLIHDFYDAIVDDNKDYIDYIEGIKAIELIDAIYKSDGVNRIVLERG